MKTRYKFGIIFSLSQLFISLVSLIEFQLHRGQSDMGTVGSWIIMILGVVLFTKYENIYHFINNLIYRSDYAPGHSEFFPLIIFIVLNSIIYFFVGYAIGLLVEVFKGSNLNERNKNKSA